jgi:hypothetical protein
MEVSRQLHAPTALPPGKNPRYPLDMRLGGPQSRSASGGEEKNSQPPPEIEPENSDRPARSQSLHRLSHRGSKGVETSWKTKSKEMEVGGCEEANGWLWCQRWVRSVKPVPLITYTRTNTPAGGAIKWKGEHTFHPIVTSRLLSFRNIYFNQIFNVLQDRNGAGVGYRMNTEGFPFFKDVSLKRLMGFKDHSRWT